MQRVLSLNAASIWLAGERGETRRDSTGICVDGESILDMKRWVVKVAGIPQIGVWPAYRQTPLRFPRL